MSEPDTPRIDVAVPPKRLGVQARIAVAVVVALAAAALFWPHGEATSDAPGGFLLDAAGRPQTLGPRMAPVTLVHFWATWCPPCITEVPALDRLVDHFATDPRFKVLMVAVEDEAAKVQTFRGSRAAGVLYDPNWEVAHRYGTDKIPETYLVVGGRVVEKWVGMTDWDDPAVRQRIERALAAAGPATASDGSAATDSSS